MKSKKESRAARRKRVIRNRIIAAGVLVILIVVIIIIVVSCSKNDSSGSRQDAQAVEAGAAGQEDAANTDADIGEDADATENAAAVSASDITNEKPVTLYTMDYNTMTCKKATKISKPWDVGEDLESFGAFVSTEDSFPFTSETQAHKDTWNSKETETDYKIGYELSFDLNGTSTVITILKPGDIEDNPDLFDGNYPDNGDYSGITGYLGCWVYDDMNQEEGAFYTHIFQSEVKDDTLLTSIKLRPTPQSDQIDNLVLKAFSYSSDKEFDANGHYIGKYASQVEIAKE